MGATTKSDLPKKDLELFFEVVSCYDKKEYKAGLKLVDQLLSHHPKYGEALAMKGAMFTGLGRMEEAAELIREGIKLDFRSHICWHIYGLFHRAEKNYKEACKCYNQALRIDTKNSTLQRDLSWMQIQCRDFAGFADTRAKMQLDKPQLKGNHIALAAAHYFNGKYAAAYEVLRKAFKLPGVETITPVEESELLMFQIHCLEKLNKFEDAIKFIAVREHKISDKFALYTKRAELHLLNGQFSDAITMFEQLLATNSENYDLHRGLQSSILELSTKDSKEMLALPSLDIPATVLKLTPEQRNKLIAWYDASLATETFKKSRAMAKILLAILVEDSERFPIALDAYIRRGLTGGVPSLRHDLASLIRIPRVYTIENKEVFRLVAGKKSADLKTHSVVLAIEKITTDFVNEIQSLSPEELKEKKDKYPANSLLWADYLLSFVAEWKGDLEAAIIAIERAIAHTPTALDMVLRRGALLKKSGDIAGAARLVDVDCRALDLQDRYLNNKTAKYHARNNEVFAALETVALFTKHDGKKKAATTDGDKDAKEETEEETKPNLKDVEANLLRQQCSWLELEMVEAYGRKKLWGRALKKADTIRRHYVTQSNDLMDFHAYIIRNATINAYTRIVKSLDDSFSHKYFQRAACDALRILTHLATNPNDRDGLSHLSGDALAEARAAQKELRERVRDEAEEAAKKALQAAQDKPDGDNDEDDDGPPPKQDVDPNGDDWISADRDHLADAMVWIDHLWPVRNLLSVETLARMSEVLSLMGRVGDSLECIELAFTHISPSTLKHIAEINNVSPGFSMPEGESEDSAELLLSVVRLAQVVESGKFHSEVKPEVVEKVKETIKTILSATSPVFAAIPGNSTVTIVGDSLTDFIKSFLQTAIARKSFFGVVVAIKALSLIDVSFARETLNTTLSTEGSTLFSFANAEARTSLGVFRWIEKEFGSEDPITTKFVEIASSVFPRASFESPL